MSIEAVVRFLDLAERDPELGGIVKAAAAARGIKSGFELAEVAARYDCHFTATQFAVHVIKERDRRPRAADCGIENTR